MKKRFYILIIGGLLPFITFAQQIDKREKYDISKDKVLYTIGYAHLDTEWNWEYPKTINEYIKNTMEDNFKLFEKYPDYVFNFTGSRRYRMMKEYYPESYKKVCDYINQGRWFVSGSSVDEGEVNISSSESVLRQVLYGNLYFKREFNKESYDYMLPDCFGFVATMPSVWSHAGLLGFSTQKLTWGSANGLPFNVGIWEGPDGKSLLAALNATNYGGRIVERLDKDKEWSARMEDDIRKFGVSFDFRYYGTGDIGGSPRDNDVKNATGSIKQSDSNFKVVLTSSDQMFKDITPALRAKLPTFAGDLLLTEHSAGSMSSESFMKRANRKNEQLAKSAEQLASVASWLGAASYPVNKINNSWDLVLGSQFHDILPGTSTVKAYEYAWNDEFIAMNGFSEVLKNSVSAISHQLNTQVEGRAIVVYNPVATNREDVVTAELSYAKLPGNVKVVDKNGNTVPSQIISAKGNKLTVIFLARLPSAGLSVFDIRETTEKAAGSALVAKDQTLENDFFKLTINANGDIAGIYDKTALKEVLSQPASLQFLKENPASWPAWNMDWNDRKNPPIDAMNKEVTVKIIEEGPVRVAIEVSKKGRGSEIVQIISLAAGEAGKRIEVCNKIDWQSKEISLKASFPTTVVNEMATYGLNTAAIQRSTNNDVKFEVPGRQWIDLTDRPNNYGVSILEDCKYGSDKPDNSTLRLTLMYTPKARDYVYQGSQDWGIHDVKYAIYPHVGDWAYAKTPWQGSFVNAPLIGFETAKHDGSLGKEFSLVKLNTNKVDIMAFKKAEESDYYIVRFNELYGKNANGISVSFPGKIVDAYEVNGQEKKIGEADFKNGTLNFDMTKFLIRSFAVKFEEATQPASKPVQKSIDMPFNEDAISFDGNRADGNMTNSLTIPAELIPAEVISEDISFKIGSSTDGEKNAVAAKGQKINMPSGNFNKLYILAAATEDSKGSLKIGSQTVNLSVQDWTGWIGQHYSRKLYFNDLKVSEITNAYTKRDNIAWYASHRHSPEANDAYQYSYLYKYEINLPKGAKSVTLPDNDKIRIFAITAANNTNEDITPLQPLYDDFKDNKPVQLRVKEYVTPELKPPKTVQKPLFINDPMADIRDPRTIARLKSYLKSLGMDTVIVKTPPSITDYADVKSGNNVSAVYYATGKSTRGKDYQNVKMDLTQILNSQSAKAFDTIWFDNGEGRYIIDLQKSVSIGKINFYIDQFRKRGNQLFSMWASDNSFDFSGNPKDKGFKYLGIYGTGRTGMGASGTSLQFEENLKCRYLMFISDGSWHGNDFLRQLDIFVK
ncbi:MAG: glycosyl hydrolase-related protein [Bacteroidia bacterium]|nr:glycosyl hydrolase-related protein [Bacteroidia bacterium]